MNDATNDSPLGRLLEELSWEGNARKYREGGRGLENVLVTEVFQVLDLLPRDAFLAEILRRAHGHEPTLASAAAEMEQAVVDVLPGGPNLSAEGPNVQPDVLLTSAGTTVLVEAKRIRSGSFQPEQLAREYLILHRDHAPAVRVLLLLLPQAPPFPVRGHGRLSIREAVLRQLHLVHARADSPPPLADLTADLDATCAWTTWEVVDQVFMEGLSTLPPLPDSVSAAVARAAAQGRRAIAWHS